MCVLRAQGRHDEAENLRTQSLEPLVAAFHADSGSGVTIEDRLAATMAAESDRVADALLLAELLAPMLGGGAGSPAKPAPAASGTPTLRMLAPEPEPPREVSRPAVRPAASIADFLDEMIAQETPPTPPRGAAQRRAS